jgi:hypothetical protein
MLSLHAPREDYLFQAYYKGYLLEREEGPSVVKEGGG